MTGPFEGRGGRSWFAVFAAALMVLSIVTAPAGAAFESPSTIDRPIDYRSDSADGAEDAATGFAGDDPIDRGDTGSEPWYLYRDGVNLANGNLYRSTTDLAIGVLGGEIAFTRSYNSHASHEHGPLGFGWTHNYAMRLDEGDGGDAMFVDGDGSKHVFEATGGGEFDNPAGVHARLKANADGYDLRWKDGTTFRFDEEGTLEWIEDRNGNRITLEYTDGNLTRIADDAGQALNLTYNGDGRITEIEDPLGRSVEYEYDVGDLVAVTDPVGDDTEYEYFENHKLRKITEPTGLLTTVDYYVDDDRVRHVGSGRTRIQCARSGTAFAYDYDNDTVETTNLVNGNETAVEVVELNEAGNPVTFTVGSEPTEIEWDDEMNQARVINGTGAYQFEYDDYGNPIERTGPDGETFTWTWNVTDTDDRYLAVLASRTDEAGRTTEYDYDERGNLVEETNPLGDSREYAYDDDGNVVSEIGFDGAETVFEYDDHGKLTSKTSPGGGRFEYAYDAAGRQVARTNPGNNTYDYEYNDRNDLVRVRSPDGHEIEYHYDAYGALEEVVRSVGANETRSAAQPRVNGTGWGDYEFDVEDDRTVFRTDEWTVTQHLDDRNRVSSLAVDYGSFERTVEYAYDVRGNVVELQTNDVAVSYEYDDLDRLTRVEGRNDTWVEYEYDPADRPTNVTYANGVTTSYDYDQDGNVASVRVENESDGTVLEYAYAYDESGNLLSATDGDGETITYAYDALDRLVNATYPSGETVAYEYDPIGNRLTRTRNGSDVTTYEYDDEGRLVRAGNATYEYDESGNLVAKEVDGGGGTERTEYGYEFVGRLTSVELSDGETIEYQYLPSGERLSKTTSNGTTYYLYSDFTLLGEYNETGALERSYVHGPGFDNPEAMVDGDDAYFYHQDGSNDVRALTDDNGAVANRYELDPFGQVREEREGVENAHRFAGREYDLETGLYYNRMRYYDPAVGRFTREDPAGLEGGVNRYTYAENNPLGYNDPFGLDTWRGGGVSSGGMVITAGVSSFTGRMTNDRTGQSCSLTIYCGEIGLGLGGSVTTKLSQINNGPRCGKDLRGQSVDLTGCVGVGLGGTVEGCGGTGGIDAGGGVGAGAEAKLAVQVCLTKDVSCSCVEECDDCDDNDPEPEPDPDPDPRPPGGDHPDDNHDVSVLTYETRTDRSAVPRYGYRDGSIAMLDRGFAAEFGDFLTDEGIPYDEVPWNVSESELADYDLLILPSGSLTGLSALDSFGAKLEAYVDGGGTLLVMPQQRGYHWEPVPGNLRAYGWLEDQSCQYSSVGITETCPAFATESVGGETSLNVDGYFTDYPENADVLLTRTKNAQPAMLSYDRGAGRVVATTAYSDWAYGHQAASDADERILRDTVRWARQSDGIPTYNRGDDADFDLEATSYVELAVDRTEITVRDSTGAVVETITDPSAIGPLETTTLSTNLSIPADATYGIWDVEYAFENDSYGTVQRIVENDSLAVTRYEESDDGWRADDSDVSVSINSDTERYALGSNATFEITVRNDGDRTENVTLYWAYPHNSRYGEDDSLYGAGGTHPGERSPLNETLELAAGERRTIVDAIPVVNADGRDRLWLEYYEERDGELEYVGRASRGFFTFEPRVDVDLETTGTAYTSGESVPIDVGLTGQVADDVTVETRVVAPDRTLVFQSRTTVNLDGSSNRTYEPALPSPAVGGRYAVVTDVFDGDGEKIGYRSAGFDVTEGVKFRATIPETIGASTDLSFDIENVDAAPFENASVETSLVDPDGTVVWSDDATVDVDRNETARVEFRIGLNDLAFGNHALRYTFVAGSERVERARTIENAYSIAADFDEPWYRQRDDVGVTATIANRGQFETPVSATVRVPDAGFEETTEITPSPGERVAVNATVPLPDDVSAGEHDVAVTIADGSERTETFAFVVPESDLAIADVDDHGVAGGELAVVVENSGGVDTDADCTIELIGPQGIRLNQRDLSETVLAGGNVTATVSIPEQAITGEYFVLVGCTDGATGEQIRTVATADVDGLDADVTTSTDAEIYGSGETVTIAAEIANAGDAIEDGRLHLEVADPAVSEDDDGSSASPSRTEASGVTESAGTETNGDDPASETMSGGSNESIDSGRAIEPFADGGTDRGADRRSAEPVDDEGTRSTATLAAASSSDENEGATRRAGSSIATASLSTADTIDGRQVWEDEEIVLNESLVINATGEVTMRNVTLRFDGTSDGDIGVLVREGGRLSVLDGSTVESASGTEYFFRVNETAAFELRDSTVRDVIGKYTGAPLDEQGLYVAADGAIVGNATIEGGRRPLVLDGVDGVTVANSTFVDTGLPLLIDGSTNVSVTGNTFERYYGVHLVDSTGNEIVGNVFTDDASSDWSVELEGGGDNAVRDNAFGEGDGIRVDSSTGNAISDNGFVRDQRWEGAILITGGSTGTTIDGNDIVGGDEYAVRIESANITAANNTIDASRMQGIHVTAANVTLTNNTVSNSGRYGIYLDRAEGATLRDNTLTSAALHVDGYDDSSHPSAPDAVPDRRYYDHDIDASNAADGGPIRYLLDETGGTIDADGGAVWLINASDVTVTGEASVGVVDSTGVELRDLNTPGGVYYGVYLAHADDATVSNVTSTGNRYGVTVLGAYTYNDERFANGMIIEDSDFSDNEHRGLHAKYVENVTVRNTVAGNSTRAKKHEVYVYHARNVTLTNVTVSQGENAVYSSGSAIYLDRISHSAVLNSTVNGYEDGISVRGNGEYNTVSNNTVSGSRGERIEVYTHFSTVSDNVAIGGDEGFRVWGDDSVAERNNATGSAGGMNTASRRGVARNNEFHDTADYGIRIQFADTTVEDNVVTTDGVGTVVDGSGDNAVLTGNSIAAVDAGVKLDQVENATLRNNTLANAGLDVRYQSWSTTKPEYVNHDIDESNTVLGKPLTYLYDEHDVDVDAGSSQVWVANSTNVTVRNAAQTTVVLSEAVTIENVTADGWNLEAGLSIVDSTNATVRTVTVENSTRTGVLVEGSTGTTIEDATVSKNGAAGLVFSNAEWNEVTNATIEKNEGYGIHFRYSASNNTVRNATVANHTASNSQIGIYVDRGSDNELVDVRSVGNSGRGIYVRSDGNVLRRFEASNNGAEGVHIYGDDNEVVDSTATGNGNDGFDVQSVGNLLENVTATANGDSGVELNWQNHTVANSTLAGNYYGVKLDQTTGNVLTGNRITDNDRYGAYLTGESTDSLLYDNYFDNPDARAEAYENPGNSWTDPSENRWNVTKAPAADGNVVGGEFYGGNYWADYNGSDTDVDGLGDTDLPYNATRNGYGGLVGGDYHPLVPKGDGDRSRVVWETNVSVDVAAGAIETVDVEVPASELAGEGKRKLSATLYATTNQTVAFEDPPFYVFDGDTTLTMNADEEIYTTGDAVTIEGNLTNDGGSEQTYDLTIEKDGAEIHDETVTLAAGESHTYAVTTAAEAPFALTADAGGVTIADEISVVDPSVNATAIAPEVTGRGAFAVGAELENDGEIPIDVDVTVDRGVGGAGSVTIAPGETRRVAAETTIDADTTFAIDVSGDVDETLAATVRFGEDAATTVSPADVYAPGTVEIPYAVANAGDLAAEFDVAFAIDGETERETVYAPVGGTDSGTVAFDLDAGTHAMTYETPFESGTMTVEVRERDRLALSADVPANASKDDLEIPVTLANEGSNDLNGTIVAGVAGASGERGFDVGAGENRTVTVSVPLSEATDPGTYDVGIEALVGEEPLASASGTVEVLGPQFAIEATPPVETYELGEVATWNYTVVNEGNADGNAALAVAVPGMSAGGVVQRDDAWLAPGERRTLSVAVPIADDVEEGRYEARYELGDETGGLHAAGETAFDVAGANVSVDAALDAPVYEIGENATLAIDVTNERDSALDLFVRAQYNGFDEREAISLDGEGDARTVAFEVPITEGNDRKIFFGVYHADGRSLHIDGRYPREKTGNVTLYTDGERYEPGDNATVTVEPGENGTLTIATPWQTWNEPVVAGQTETFEFQVPPARTGTYYVHYALDDESYSYPFDVDGYNARVTGARFAGNGYEAGETVELDLALEPTRDVNATVTGTLVDAAGGPIANASESAALETDGTDVRIAIDVPEDAGGVHAIVYEIEADVDGNRVLSVTGAEFLEIDALAATNRPPVAAVEYAPSDPEAGETVTFDGSNSDDPDGSIDRYEWDLDGDGSVDETGTATSAAFDAAGEYEVALTVTDDDGATDRTSVTVTVSESDGGDGGPGGDGGDGNDGDDDSDGDDGDEPSFVLEDLEIDAAEIDAGESASVSATVRNRGADGEFDAELRVDGAVVETQTVVVPAGERREIDFRVTIDEPGTYEIDINGEFVGSLTVVDDTADEHADEADGDDDTGANADGDDDPSAADGDDSSAADGDDGVPLGPFGGALATIVALLLSAAAVARKRD